MEQKIEKMTYEQKEARLDEILERLDSSETPVDKLAEEAKEAALLIKSMNATLTSAKKELTTVFTEIERLKQE